MNPETNEELQEELNEQETPVEEATEETAETSAEETQEESEDVQTEEELTEEDKLAEANDKYLRLVAEFDNFRRRTAKENLTLIESANNKLLEKLSEVVENFDRALAEENQGNPEDFVKGVGMIKSQFDGILKDFGLKEINPEGEQFDPNMHEALMQQPSEDVPEGTILNVFQKGFQVKDKVIKHAKVIVSAGQA